MNYIIHGLIPYDDEVRGEVPSAAWCEGAWLAILDLLQSPGVSESVNKNRAASSILDTPIKSFSCADGDDQLFTMHPACQQERKF